MTIPKNTKRARQIIENSKNIKSYALASGFHGTPLAERPQVWGGPIEGRRFRHILEVSQQEFLFHELRTYRHAKLVDNENGRYTLHIHDNLWYEFEA